MNPDLNRQSTRTLRNKAAQRRLCQTLGIIMKRFLVLLLFICCGVSNAADVQLFHANSKELGYDAIDIDVTEIARKERTSTLHIRGFQSRSAFGSRWLICAYTSLALQRGFKSWKAYYPLPPDENLLLIFPASETDDLSTLSGQQLDKARLVPSAPFDKMLAFCSKVLAK